MIFDIDFSKEEVARLYLTYKRRPENYDKIKKRLMGSKARKEYHKGQRGRYFFMGAVIAISMVGSAYAFFLGHWGSFGAIWLICAAFLIALGTFSFVAYRNFELVFKRNVAFFEQFEALAEKRNNVEDFQIDWNLKEKAN